MLLAWLAVSTLPLSSADLNSHARRIPLWHKVARVVLHASTPRPTTGTSCAHAHSSAEIASQSVRSPSERVVGAAHDSTARRHRRCTQ